MLPDSQATYINDIETIGQNPELIQDGNGTAAAGARPLRIIA